ncbi:MAG: hypothetical protein AB1793_07970 [Candidatus Thermoplasmatota archaeon]
MKGKILSLALALCMIAVVFTALPTKGAVYYTGTVQTTDDAGLPMDVFFRGDHVYVNVTLYYENVLVDADILVELVDENGNVRDSIYTTTDDPVDGYYNSSAAIPIDSLNTNGVPISGDMTVCDIVLYVEDYWWWTEVDREQIVLKETGLSLDPPNDWYYYPGQDVTITVTTGDTDAFYVQILNETDDDMVPPWTYQTVDEDGVWSETFTIPEDAKDGEYLIEVRAETSDALWFDELFWVAKYALMLDTDRYYVLPGENVEVEYMVVDMATLSLYSDVTVEWNAEWYNETNVLQVDTGELVPGYFGTEIFTIPAEINLTSDYDVYFWANDTADRSMETWITFYTGDMMGDVWTEDDTYLAGEVVVVSAQATVNWYSLPEADVDIVVEKDGAAIAAYGASDLTTGVNGVVEHEFQLASDADPGTYVVTATMSKVGYTVVRMTTFDIDLEYDLDAELDKDQYYSGETATVTFTTVWGVEEVENNSVFYIVYSSLGNVAVGNTSSGEASFAVPDDYVGWIDIEAVTIVNGYYLDAWDDAWVQKAYIAIAPVAEIYSGGDTVQWEFEILTEMTSGMLSYEVVDAGGEPVASSSMDFATSGMISFTVPGSDPSTEYTVTLTLKDGLGNNVEAESSVWLEEEYTISVWLVSDSGYVSRAFEPGAEIEFGYEITTNGAPHMSVYKIRYYSYADYIDMYVLTNDTSGTLTVTVPEDTPDGYYGIWVTLYDGVENTWLSSDGVDFVVMADQSGWDKEVIGMSAIDFVMLVLIIVMILLLIVVPFLKTRGPGLTKSEPAPPAEPPAPPTQ